MALLKQLSNDAGAPPRPLRVRRAPRLAGGSVGLRLLSSLWSLHICEPRHLNTPHTYPYHPPIHPQMFAKEILFNAAFVLGFLVLPEALAVNRRPAHWAWLALLPLLAYRLPDQGS